MTALLGTAVAGRDPVGGGSICEAFRVRLADGRVVFAKTRAGAPAGCFETEAAGLGRLAVPGGAPVPEVLEVRPDRLVLEWVEPGPPTEPAAEQLGRRLAVTHAAGEPVFGTGRPGWIGALPLPAATGDSWPAWWAEHRLLPYARLAADRGALGGADLAAVETAIREIDRLAGPPEPPARCHGDLWGGNVHWSAGGPAYLVDPAVQGGHRETDLATLALFGLPHLDRLLAAYADVAPLAPGHRHRVPLHQLHLLLVHAAMFGGGYAGQCAAAARAALRAA